MVTAWQADDVETARELMHDALADDPLAALEALTALVVALVESYARRTGVTTDEVLQAIGQTSLQQFNPPPEDAGL